jgi:hypothetical protein
MKTLTKHLKTLKQAERFQNHLYGRYEHVRLVRVPRFGEAGKYVWEVK